MRTPMKSIRPVGPQPTRLGVAIWCLLAAVQVAAFAALVWWIK